MRASFKRGYLIGLIVLTAIASVLVIAVMLAGSGRSEDMAMTSAVGLGYLVVVSFAAFNTFDHRIWRIPAVIGAGVAALMVILLPVFAVLESMRGYSGTMGWIDFLGNCVGTGLTTAGLFCLAPFILAGRVKTPGPIVQVVTAIGYVALYICFQFLIWSVEFIRGSGTLFYALFVLCGAGTLIVFFLRRFFGIKVPNPVSSVSGSIHLTCPRCLKPQDMGFGEGRCAFCKLRIKIEVEEALCPSCGYNLHALTHPVCPECGTRLLAQEVATTSVT